jgi:hypothetical protein
MMSFDEFAVLLEKKIAEVRPEIIIGLEKVGTLAQTLAAHYPGTYQPGWKPLAESTLEDKAAHGWPSPSPLKRTGDMAESIHKEVDAMNLEVTIGSNEPKALWQEMGTTRGLPPRPFLSLALRNSLPYARDTFNEIAFQLLSRK